MPDKSYGGGSYNSGYGSKSKTQTSNKADKTSLPSWKSSGIRFLSGSGGGGGGISTAYKGTNLSSADRAMASKGGMGDAMKLRAAVNSALPTIASIIAGGKTMKPRDMQDNVGEIGDYWTNPVATAKMQQTAWGGVNRAAKPYVESLGNDVADSIENRAAMRVAQGPGPLRGSSSVGRSPMISPMAGQGVSGASANRLGYLAAMRPASMPQSPMAGQGAPGFGPTSVFASRYNPANLRSSYDKFAMSNFNKGGLFGGSLAGADTLGPDYGTGDIGPQSGPETMPDPTAGQPTQKYNVADSFRYDVNPSQQRQPIPGFLERVPGLIGGVASGLNWLSNLPGDGPEGSPYRMYGSGPDRQLNNPNDPQTATGAPNPVAAAKAPPVGVQFPQFLYPEYTQAWAGLPRGLYGRG
jgi:hypothetical protein